MLPESSRSFPSEGKTRVLIVEDDRVAMRAMRWLLNNAGYEVFTACSIEQAIEMLENHPRYVILDLMLPDGSGELVIDELERRPKPPCVIITSGSGIEMIEHAKTRKVLAMLHKPVMFDELLSFLTHAAP